MVRSRPIASVACRCAISLAACLLASCDANELRARLGLADVSSPTSIDEAVAPHLEDVEIELDLVELFDIADRRRNLSRLSIKSPSELAFLTAGWHEFEVAAEPFVWSKGRVSVIEVPRSSTGDLTAILDLGTLPDAEALPVQNLKLYWNGVDLGSYELRWERQSLEVPIPSAIQRHGPNRLELMPLYWIDPRSALVSDDPRQVGVQLFGAHFVSQEREVYPQRVTSRIVGRDVVQTPGTIVTYGLELPMGARLQLDGLLTLPAEVRSAPVGELWISLLDQQGQEHIVYSADVDALRASPTFTLDVDLSGFEGQLVSLSFGFSLQRRGQMAGRGDGYHVSWKTPRITGTRRTLRHAASEIPRDRYNVMLVLFDTLRADDTSPYGSLRVDTPAMANLASEGVTFVNAFANSSWTKPSVTSLLTSLYPVAHKVVGERSVAHPELPRLGTALQGAGYYTAAISNNPHLSEHYGLAVGFDVLHEYFRTSREQGGDRRPEPETRAKFVWNRYVEPILARDSDAPFFVYLHELDPHFPYDAPPPYSERYDFGYRGHFAGADTSVQDTMKMFGAVNRGAPWTSEADIRHLRARYAAEITFMDAYLAWILDALESRGLRDDTLVVFLSDHGEAFMEHRFWGHGANVFDELLRVPMIFSLPGVLPEGRRPQVDAQIIDVSPTVLDLVGVAAPAATTGRSLLPYMILPDEYRPGRPIFAKSNWNKADRTEFDSIRYRGWKLIRRNYKLSRPGHYEFELYDVATDPGETLDLWAAEPVVGHALRQMMDRQHRSDARLGSAVEAVEAEVDPGILEQLKVLGYTD